MLSDGTKYTSDALIVATGGRSRTIGVPGEEQLKGILNNYNDKTYLTDFLDKHPNAPLANGIPSGLCPYYLGYMTKKELTVQAENGKRFFQTIILYFWK